MGGTGSGRRWQCGVDTTDDYRSIDVRRWKREGLLEPFQAFGWEWTFAGETTASIRVETAPGRVFLTYRHRTPGEDWQDNSYPISLTTTECYLGGNRDWFLCPARGCRRRVAILYGGAVFACRHCHRLAYASQREKPHDRAARRAERIRNRLGWPYGILEGSDWGKPTGMHWTTYRRLEREYEEASSQALAGILDYLHCLSDA